MWTKDLRNIVDREWGELGQWVHTEIPSLASDAFGVFAGRQLTLVCPLPHLHQKQLRVKNISKYFATKVNVCKRTFAQKISRLITPTAFRD